MQMKYWNQVITDYSVITWFQYSSRSPSPKAVFDWARTLQ